MTSHNKYINILHLTWESPTLLWTFKVLRKANETRNSLNACLLLFQFVRSHPFVLIRSVYISLYALVFGILPPPFLIS